MLVMRYGISPGQFFKDMSMQDLQIFIDNLQEKVEAENKEMEKENRGNKLMKSLLAIMDILIFMFPLDKRR